MVLEFSITNTFSISERQTISLESALNDPATDRQHCIDCNGKKILKMACIYGANASGKTNILEALRFYAYFMLSSFTRLKPDDAIDFTPFKFDPQLQNQPGAFEIVLYLKNSDTEGYTRYEYNLKLTRTAVVYESVYYAPKGQKKLIVMRDEHTGIKWGSDIPGPKKAIENLVRPNCSLLSASQQVQFSTLKRLALYLTVFFAGIIGMSNEFLRGNAFAHIRPQFPQFKDYLVQLLSASDMGTISDIKVEHIPITEDLAATLPQEMQERVVNYNGKLTVQDVQVTHHYDNHDYTLSIDEESAGTIRMIELSALLHSLKYENIAYIISIDELETSLHRELIETFLELFLYVAAESQLIFTTHDQDLLDSGLLRDDEVWFCYKTDKGNSVYNSITDYTGIRKGVSRKKLYNADKFGALPLVNVNVLKELFYTEKNSENTK